MKIKYIQISNVLSFKFSKNIEDATKISLDDGVNILIGQNGAGIRIKKLLIYPVSIALQSVS